MTPTSMRRESPQPSERLSIIEEPQNTSDGESGERPVREKLRDTKIEGQTNGEDASETIPMVDASAAPVTTTEPSNDRGQLRRKRSIEDVEGANEDKDAAEPWRHVRKRSREAIPGSDVPIASSTAEESMEDAPVEKSNSSLINRSRRSATPDTASDHMEDEKKERLTSPKNKRTRDQVLREDEEASATTAEALLPDTTAAYLEEQKTSSEKTDSDEERKVKRSRDIASPSLEENGGFKPPISKPTEAKIPPSSGFANTSTTSPFATSGLKSPLPQTSASAFASSGFSSLANKPSAFGGATAGAASPFGISSTAGKPSILSSGGLTFGGPKDGTSAFATDSSKSTFGSAFTAKPASTIGSSVFGSASGGFASAFGSTSSGSKLNSFAGGSGPKIEGLTSKPAKEFGAANVYDSDENEDEGSDDEKATVKSPRETEEVRKDKRFYEQDVETGEEHEENIFTHRAKLYSFSSLAPGEEKKWVERGVGNLKLNLKAEPPPEAKDFDGCEGKKKARFIMRAEGSHRVVLNSPVQKGSNFGERNGDRPKGTQIMFLGLPEGLDKLETMLLKLKAEAAGQLWDEVQALQDEI